MNLFCFSMEISDNSNSNLQRLVDMVFTHSEFGQVMIDTVCSEPKSAIVYLLFNSCLIGSEAEAIPMRESCVPLLLSCYGATLSTADQMILAILELCERQGRFDFSSYSPLLWGKRAAQHYSSLKLLGPSLWIRPTVDEVLDLIDPDIMLTTGIHIPLELLLNTAADKLLSVLNQTVGNLYDPRFILPLMVSLLLPNQELNCKKIVEKNILGLAIATLSCRDRDLRGLGYLMLNRFRKMLKTSEKFTSRAQIICLLNALKEGVTEENQRVPCVITIFLVKSAQILLNPENQLFKLISSFITLKVKS